jgi:hypothetical protein
MTLISDEHTKLLFDAGKFLLGTLVGAAVKTQVGGKADLVSYYGHVSAFTATVNGQPFVLHTHEVVVRNTGRKAATNVRFHHAFLPDQFNVFPSVPYSVQTLPDGTKDIVFPTVVPKQQLTVAYLYYPPMTVANVNAGIMSDDGFARPVAMDLSQKPRNWIIVICLLLIVIGGATVLYELWKLLDYFGW